MLLQSQFATLEPLQQDERGATVSLELSPDEILHQIVMASGSVV